jgi:exosome complex exonuclease DIS3/RRP44
VRDLSEREEDEGNSAGAGADFVYRRHMPPPKVNFDKLSDILQKRRGLSIEVSSSGALATSLDRCVVSNFP